MKLLFGGLGATLVIGLAIFGYTEGWGADWKYYATDGENVFYYDKDSITSPTKESFRVWVRIIESEELIKAWQEKQGILAKSIREEMSGVSEEEIDKAHGEYLQVSDRMKKEVLNNLIVPEKRMLEEIKCAIKMVRVISHVDYGKTGEVLHHFSSSTTNWQHIVPETTVEALYKAVCK